MYACLSDHHMKGKLQGYTKNRLKRSSFVHEAGYMDTRPLRCFWKWTSRHTRERSCYCELPKYPTITKAIMMPSQEKDAYQLFSMSEQVIMIRLRTGHSRLNAHMHNKLNMVLWAACTCGEEDQTNEQILQNCERHDQKRYAAWPTEKTLNQKLYGDEENIRHTTKYILDTGLTV